MRAGDRILSVNEEDVRDLAGLWRRVWASGSAGAEVRLRLQRDATTDEPDRAVRRPDQVPEGAQAALIRSRRHGDRASGGGAG